jgi:hypothetical protein
MPVVTLNNPTPAHSDNFGFAVAIDGARAVVGAVADNTGAADAGIVYVYDLGSGTPATATVILQNPSPNVSDYFGYTVAISGSRVVVGAPDDDTYGADAGLAYVYDVAGGTPTVPVVTLLNPDGSAGDKFGVTVGISGTLVAVGRPRMMPAQRTRAAPMCMTWTATRPRRRFRR